MSKRALLLGFLLLATFGTLVGASELAVPPASPTTQGQAAVQPAVQLSPFTGAVQTSTCTTGCQRAYFECRSECTTQRCFTGCLENYNTCLAGC